MTSDLALTDEQKAIVAFVKAGQGHLLVDAGAGCAKTTTLVEALKRAPQRSSLMCAFNKGIAETLQERIGKPPPGFLWKAQTFHSAGLKIVHAHRPRLDVRAEASEDLVNIAAERFEMDGAERGSKERVSFQIRRAAVRLLRTVKETRTDTEISPQTALAIGMNFDVLGKLPDNDQKTASEIVSRAYTAGLDLKARTALDFCDMTWLPVVLDLAPPSRYQIVFVDEAQDLSLPQLALVQKLVAPKGRLVMVGDKFQGIYGWRGAVGDVVWQFMTDHYEAKSLPLTTTWRCSCAVVKEANKLVPSLRPRPGAPVGSVTNCQFEELPKLIAKDLKSTTFVLSRNNSDLLHTALYLWKADLGFQLYGGKEIVEPLYEIIDKLDKRDKNAFTSSLTTWFTDEMAKADKINATAWADRIEQQHDSLLMMLEYAEPRAFKSILQDILYLSSMSPLVLSSVHKVKGLEADRVYLLKQTFERFKREADLEHAVEDWQIRKARERLATIPQEEENLLYVAITRAKTDVVYVDMRGASTIALSRLIDAQKASKP